jgi:methionyl-tRNA formyltransferase
MRTFRTVFMGTPDFAVPSLEALFEGPDEVVAVVTQPDRPSGRGQKMQPPPVKAAAETRGVPVLQPERIRGEKGAAFRERLAALAPDLVVVAAFGQILPQEVLDLPPAGCINVHASLLPRWRGASPIQWAIAEGDAETGICIMEMEAGLDTGPVIHRRVEAIGPDDTGGTLHDRLARLGATALREALDLIRRGEARPEPQDDAASTYAPMLKREDGRLDFDAPAEVLDRRIRAFQPWPGAFTTLEGKLLKVQRAEARPGPGAGTGAAPGPGAAPGSDGARGTAAAPGTVIAAGKAGVDVACGAGILRLLEVQPEGRRRMDAAAFAAGQKALVGARLGT